MGARGATADAARGDGAGHGGGRHSSARAAINWGNSVLLSRSWRSALQVGTNYANDYSDGIRGTDEVRVGPFRLTASKLVAAKSVRNAAFASFLLAGVRQVCWLASRTSWWLVAVGATAVIGGRMVLHRRTATVRLLRLRRVVRVRLLRHRGDRRHGAHVQHLTFPSRSWWLGVATGFMACALLEANNLRDVQGDQSSGKKTLAARLGRAARAVALRGMRGRRLRRHRRIEDTSSSGIVADPPLRPGHSIGLLGRRTDVSCCPC